MWRFGRSGKLTQPAGNAKILPPSNGFQSSAIVPEWCCKAPDRSLDRPCGLLTRVFPPALRAAAGQARLEHATHLRLAHAEDAGDLPSGERRARPFGCKDGFVHRDRVLLSHSPST